MKKILSLILVMALVLSLVSCGAKKEASVDADNKKPDKEVSEALIDTPQDEEEKEEDKKPQEDKSEAVSKEENTEKPSKPSSEEKPSNQPKPEEAKPAEKTVGQTLLSDFKQKANSDVLTIAEALISNPMIQFMGGAMEVEEGYLAGFDEEIKGFKKGAMFAPMIGSIAFVGYVFELSSASDVSAFIANLKETANLRWNVCVEAEEMVTGSSGNKVFFVMCPKSFE